MQLEELEEAEKAFVAAVKLESDHVPALHNLAVIYDRTERMEEALSYYEKVQALAPHLHTIDAVRHAHYDVKFLVE